MNTGRHSEFGFCNAHHEVMVLAHLASGQPRRSKLDYQCLTEIFPERPRCAVMPRGIFCDS
jgi:hypothetical protein